MRYVFDPFFQYVQNCSIVSLTDAVKALYILKTVIHCFLCVFLFHSVSLLLFILLFYTSCSKYV